MTSLLYPWLIILLSLTTIFFAFRKRWIVSGVCFILTILLNLYSECFALNLIRSNRNVQNQGFRLMSWNIHTDSTDNKAKLSRLAKTILENAPDLIFITEIKGNAADSLNMILSKDFPYSTYDNFNQTSWYHIYSKSPMYESKAVAANILRIVTQIGNDTICVYGCHFTSNNFDVFNNYITPEKVQSYRQAANYIKNISYASNLRKWDSYMLVDNLKNSVYPTFIIGDLNDVAKSPSLNVLTNAGFKDAWWKAGFGYGATVHHPFPYRIDHILFKGKNNLKLKAIKKIRANGLSDHDALVADFTLE